LESSFGLHFGGDGLGICPIFTFQAFQIIFWLENHSTLGKEASNNIISMVLTYRLEAPLPPSLHTAARPVSRRDAPLPPSKHLPHHQKEVCGCSSAVLAHRLEAQNEVVRLQGWMRAKSKGVGSCGAWHQPAHVHRFGDAYHVSLIKLSPNFCWNAAIGRLEAVRLRFFITQLTRLRLS